MSNAFTDGAVQMMAALHTPRPASEYHEDMGSVLWWKFPIVEAPYVGSPLDLGKTLTIDLQITLHDYNAEPQGRMVKVDVGGWPGYHTHFTPIPKVNAP